MKKIFFLMFIMNMSICSSQVFLKKESPAKKNIFSSTEKIDNVFSKDGKLYFSLLKGERPNAKTNSVDRIFTIKDEQNVEYTLKQNEYFVDFQKDKLYTFIENVAEHQREYVVYDFNESRLEKKASLKLSLSSSMNILKSGDVMVTDGGHSGADWIRLYSSEFLKIYEFNPFNSEFHFQYDTNENHITYATQINFDAKIRIAIYGASDKKTLIKSQELDIDSDLLLLSIKQAGENTALLFSSTTNGKSHIMLLDKNLKTMTKIPLTEGVSHNKIVGIGSDIYLNTRSNVICIDTKEQKVKWSLKKEKTPPTKTEHGYKFTGSTLFKIDEKYIALVEGTYEDRVEEIKNVKIKILDVNDTSNYIQNIDVEHDFLGDIKLQKTKSGIIIFANNEMLYYEKQ